MRHQLVGLLGRGVQRDRMVDVLVHRERHLGVEAVDGRRRREDQVLDRVVAAPLEDVEETDDVAVHVGVGVDQ